jgi:hypothetical protein
MCKLEGYKCSLSIGSKTTMTNTQEKEEKYVDSILFLFFKKKTLNPSLIPTPYLPQF